MYESMCESWLLSRSAPLEKQVAALRLVLACLSCWAFQYPLTEDRCMDLLMVGALLCGESLMVGTLCWEVAERVYSSVGNVSAMMLLQCRNGGSPTPALTTDWTDGIARK